LLLRKIHNEESRFCLENFESCPEDEENPYWYKISDEFNTPYHFQINNNIIILGSHGVYELNFDEKNVNLINN